MARYDSLSIRPFMKDGRSASSSAVAAWSASASLVARVGVQGAGFVEAWTAAPASSRKVVRIAIDVGFMIHCPFGLKEGRSGGRRLGERRSAKDGIMGSRHPPRVLNCGHASAGNRVRPMGPRVHFGGGLVLGTLSGRARQRPLAKDSTRGGAAPS